MKVVQMNCRKPSRPLVALPTEPHWVNASALRAVGVACHEPDPKYEGGSQVASALDQLLTQLDPEERSRSQA